MNRNIAFGIDGSPGPGGPVLLMTDPRTVDSMTLAADAATDIAALLVVRETTAAAALLDPLRLQMLHMLEQPDSASGLARRLGLPRQKINYHVRELERHGFVRTLSQRRKGNCVERVVQSVARAFLIGPEALGPLAPDAARTQGSERNPLSLP